jgi:hypothetical protein
MICKSCGVQNIPGAKYCDHCGLTLPATGSAAELTQPGLPLPPPATSLKAVFSLISGLLFFIPFSGIGAIVLGHWSRGEIKRSAGRLKGSGIALAGLVLGYGSIAVVVAFIAAVLVMNPANIRGNMMRGLNAGRVGASLSLITTAEKSYAKKYPEVGYACSLSELGGRDGTKEHAGLIDEELASGEKYGYTFELLNCEDHKHFSALATPKLDSSGTIPIPAVCMDENGTISDSIKGLAPGCRKVGKEDDVD